MWSRSVRLHLVRVDAAPPDAAPLALPGRTDFGAVAIETWIEHAAPVAWPDGRWCAVADAERVGTTASVRAGLTGERFRPLGRGGSKLVRDALVEAGIPAAPRASRS
jgi:tRNA(Ile)-lysidine synthase